MGGFLHIFSQCDDTTATGASRAADDRRTRHRSRKKTPPIDMLCIYCLFCFSVICSASSSSSSRRGNEGEIVVARLLNAVPPPPFLFPISFLLFLSRPSETGIMGSRVPAFYLYKKPVYIAITSIDDEPLSPSLLG